MTVASFSILQDGKAYSLGFQSSPVNSCPADQTSNEDDHLEEILSSLEVTRERFRWEDFSGYKDISSPNPSLASSCIGPASVPEDLSATGVQGSHSSSCSSSSTPQSSPASQRESSEGENLPQGVRLPQRKGGMHLWQFLYAMLCDTDNRYSQLIEWTSNKKEFEFRLLEPEAIALWWGHHKNKSNMSYDKLSRSLRYYYSKKIIRKISGERYVYRFCVDPEVMYDHIGNSNDRPLLKPMPESARRAMSHLQTADDTLVASPSNKATRLIVAEDAELFERHNPRKRSSPSAHLSEHSSSVTGGSFNFPPTSPMTIAASTSSYPYYQVPSPSKRWSTAQLQPNLYSNSYTGGCLPCPTTLGYNYNSLPTAVGFPPSLPVKLEEHSPHSLPPVLPSYSQSVSPLPGPNQAYTPPLSYSPCELPPFSSLPSIDVYSEALGDADFASDSLSDYTETHTTSTLVSDSANLLWPTLVSELDW